MSKNPTLSENSTKMKVGIFVIFCIGLIGLVTIFVNDKPYWWRSCKPVLVKVEDATGLQMKSAVRSLGLDIGYLEKVELGNGVVKLAICITAPVEIYSETRAYVRSQGFLGDRFLELKPVRYIGGAAFDTDDGVEPGKEEESRSGAVRIFKFFVPEAKAEEAHAQEVRSSGTPREVPIGANSQDLMIKMDKLVEEVTGLTQNLKKALNPEDISKVLKQLNKTLENAGETLSPQGSLTTTAQRTLAKLEEAIEQLRDQMARINRGEGSVGRFLNDPVFAELAEKALINLNKLLNKFDAFEFMVEMGAQRLEGYDGTRGFFHIGLWPTKKRYYLLGLSQDPRGSRSNQTTTTTSGGQSVTVETETIDETGILFTGMLGVVLQDRLDLAAGLLYGDGAGRVTLNLGPLDDLDQYQLEITGFSRDDGGDSKFHARVMGRLQPWSIVTLYGGVEQFQKVGGKTPWLVGAGIRFRDDEIKFLFGLY